MFIKASTLLLSLVAFVNAVPNPQLAARTTATDSVCDTGSIQCCNQTLDASSGANSVLGLLGIGGTIEGLLGLDCSPLSVIGIGSGADCVQEPVCCENVTSGGLVGLNCSPLNLTL